MKVRRKLKNYTFAERPAMKQMMSFENPKKPQQIEDKLKKDLKTKNAL